MTLKKRMNRILALGLTVSGVLVSSHNIYALEGANKETVKATNNVELKINQDKKIETTKREMVTASALNVRKEATKDSEVVGSLKKNDIVIILEAKGEWSKIQVSEGVEGWINNKYTTNEKAKVNVNKLNLREEPSIESNKIDVLKRNIELEILGHANEKSTSDIWYEVKLTDEETSEEKIGFVHSDHILTESEEAKLIAEANKKAEADKNVEVDKTVESNQAVSNSSSSNTTKPEEKEPVKESTSSSVAGRTMTVNASAYSGDTITSTGTVPKWGTIAVDPSVIPYGTKVYIPMFDKVFIAEDCGSAIKGNKIDIFMNNAEDMTNFGRRNIEIKILG